MTPTGPHQALYRRWRAQTFGQIVGQQPVVETLRNAVRSGRTAHAYLFVGPRGTGKTSLARILAKALNCTNLRDGEPCDACPSCVAIREGRALDVSEFDAASNNRVDDIRDLVPRIYTAPSDLRRKVFIVDEVQRIREGWDVLLKTLEEPPEHAVFVFCTTDSSQIRPAVLSRVQRFDFRRLTVAEIAGKLQAILAADDRAAEPEAVELIARLAAGGMRDAESMLDQLLSADSGELTADRVRDVLGLVEDETVTAFLTALVGGDGPIAGLELLDALEERGRDLRAFAEQAVERLREALVESLGRGTQQGLARFGPAPLAAAARRLAAIDLARLGPGGIRLQLELALLTPEPMGMAAALPASAPVVRPAVPAAGAAGSGTGPHGGRAAAAGRPSPAEAPQRPSRGSGPQSADGPASPAESTTSVARPARPRQTPASGAPTPTRGSGTPATPVSSAGPSTPGDAGGSNADASRAAASGADGGPASRPATDSVRPAAGTLQQLLERWPEIVTVVSRNPPAKPLVEACRPISVEGSVVTLGFPEAQAFLRDAAERRRKVLEDGVSRVLGVPVSVRCVATNVEVAPLGEDADGQRLLEEFRRIYGDDVVDVGEVG